MTDTDETPADRVAAAVAAAADDDERLVIAKGEDDGLTPLFALYADAEARGRDGVAAAERLVWRALGVTVLDDLRIDMVNREVFATFPTQIGRDNGVLPLGVADDGTVDVVMVDPLDRTAAEHLRGWFAGHRFSVAVADPELVASVYTLLLNEETARQRESTLAADIRDEREALGTVSAGREEDLRWRRMLEGWVVQAYDNNASDIHIEHRTDALVVRMRMDGVLTVVARLDVSNAHRIINVGKTMSRMDIAERRRPQDGRMTVATPAGARVALRVGSFPVGDDREKLAMRLVREYAGFDNIAALGLSPASRERLDRLFSYRDGIVIMTGPPGSGKTTTLYSALLQITDETVNTVTIEDPIEADIGLNQSQVVPGVYDMADALRSFLRGDPDFIMVGEIRDEDTASLAVEASLVGRLVVSSMHVSRASDAVERFVSLGVEPRLIANGLRGVANQRLLRRLCEHCKVPADPARLRDVDDWPSEPTLFDWNPAGCAICFHTGWKGRIPVAEVALFDNDELRDAVASRSTSVEIERLARVSGMAPLWDECIARVADGQTTLAEVNRAGLHDRELR